MHTSALFSRKPSFPDAVLGCLEHHSNPCALVSIHVARIGSDGDNRVLLCNCRRDNASAEPILIFKLAIIVVAAPLMLRMQHKVFDNPSISDDSCLGARQMAASQICLWLSLMIVGRLIVFRTILGERLLTVFVVPLRVPVDE